MAYVIYSKHSGVVRRITHELGTVLPSEGVLDADDDIAYWIDREIPVMHQDLNSLGLGMFLDEEGIVSYDPLSPSFTARQPVVNRETRIERARFPINAVPQLWTARAFLAAKYETLLARNTPYHCIIGEEFLTSEHIDDGNSDNYVLTNGSCVIAPGGYIQTTAFSFRERVYDDWQIFQFNRIFFMIDPEEIFALATQYDVSTDNSTWDGFEDLPRQTHYDTDTDRTPSSYWPFIRFKIANNSDMSLTVSNYVALIQRI